jgi:MFS family permease
VTSLTYYMLALNAENFKANIYVWTGLTGTVDIFGYIVSIFVLKWSTRRMAQFSLFVMAGAFLLGVLGVSKDKEIVLLVLAMCSRFCITSVYAIMTLHTAEMFPTEIRNSVLGISSTAAHFGSFFAPYIGEWDETVGRADGLLNNFVCLLKLTCSDHGLGTFRPRSVAH